MPIHPLTAICCIVRVDSRSVGPTDVAQPGDDLVLLIEIPPANKPRDVAVDVYRGADRQAGWERRLEPSTETLVLAHQLHWRDRPTASQRLMCRVRLDGRVIGNPVVLLAPAADAQGRLDGPSAAAMSDQTRLAFTDAFARLLGQPAENNGSRRVPSDDGG